MLYVNKNGPGDLIRQWVHMLEIFWEDYKSQVNRLEKAYYKAFAEILPQLTDHSFRYKPYEGSLFRRWEDSVTPRVGALTTLITIVRTGRQHFFSQSKVTSSL